MTIPFYIVILTTSGVSSTNVGSILISASCVVGLRCWYFVPARESVGGGNNGGGGGGTGICEDQEGVGLEFGFRWGACICVIFECADEDGAEARQCESGIQGERAEGGTGRGKGGGEGRVY